MVSEDFKINDADEMRIHVTTSQGLKLGIINEVGMVCAQFVSSFFYCNQLNYTQIQQLGVGLAFFCDTMIKLKLSPKGT